MVLDALDLEFPDRPSRLAPRQPVEVPVEKEVRRQHQGGQGRDRREQRAHRGAEHLIERSGEVWAEPPRRLRGHRAAGLHVRDQGETQRERQYPPGPGPWSVELAADEPDRTPDQHHQAEHERGHEAEESVQPDDESLHHAIRRRPRHLHVVVAECREEEHRQGNRSEGYRPTQLQSGRSSQRNRLRAHAELPLFNRRYGRVDRPSTCAECSRSNVRLQDQVVPPSTDRAGSNSPSATSTSTPSRSSSSRATSCSFHSSTVKCTSRDFEPL